MQTGISVWL